MSQGYTAPLRTTTVLALMLFATGGCSFVKPKSVTVPLKFRPTAQMKTNVFTGGVPDLSVHVGAVTDARDNRDQIGENVEEKKAVPIFAGDPHPTDFVRGAVRELIGRSGIKVTDDPSRADRVLALELQRFWAQERDTYEGDVRATVAVQDSSGRQLWKGTLNGTAKTFGRSLSAENYQEVFSDSVVNLVEGLLNDEGFRAALKRDARPATR